MSTIRFYLTLALLGLMTACLVLVTFTHHATTTPDLPTAHDCAIYGPGNLLDHWTPGQVLDTCATDSIGYRSTVALLAQNAKAGY